MSRIKIDFGIDLGTTNSGIAVSNKGEIKMYRTDTQRDTMPSCVMVTKRSTLAGDKAFGLIGKDKKKAAKDPSFKSNIFTEFKRTIGSSTKYETNFGRKLSSTELSAEVLKTLKSFVDNESVASAIITIPAAFEMNQISATKKAAELAGIDYVELVQEPYAAAIAYGVNSTNKNGQWLVFDFGGGTFDAALVNVSEGIIKVVDTQGDNHLGGKNIDEAIMENIFMPYFKENYSIDSILADEHRLNAFKEMWKPLAEEAKNQLSYREEHSILTDLYDEYGEDDEGEEFEIDMTITREQLKEVAERYFQKAINHCKALLQRNSLTGNTLDELILVGGPTLSPIVREMLTEQIRKPNTSIDPMTVVAKGAAVYASTINRPESVEAENNEGREGNITKLNIDYESMVVGEETFVTIKTLQEEKVVFAEIEREDKAFKSERLEINNIGNVAELRLTEGVSNNFSILVYDEQGNRLECSPDSFSIKEGTATGGAPLPHAVCIEVFDKITEKQIIKPLKGLEKNKALPALGVYNDLETSKQIRPGMDDFIEIPIYQGEPFSKATLNNHVYTIRITGEELPSLVPEGSLINLTINVDRSNIMSGKVNFLDIDFEIPFEANFKEANVTAEWLESQIAATQRSINELDNSLQEQYSNELKKVQDIFDNKKTGAGRLEVRSELQKLAKAVDQIERENEWPKLERELKEAFHNLERVNNEKGNEQTRRIVEGIRPDVEQIIREKDKKLAPKMIKDIGSLAFELERLEHLIGFILFLDKEFSTLPWQDPNMARRDINHAKGVIYETPSIERLQPIVNNLFINAGFDKRGTGGLPKGILIG